MNQIISKLFLQWLIGLPIQLQIVCPLFSIIPSMKQKASHKIHSLMLTTVPMLLNLAIKLWGEDKLSISLRERLRTHKFFTKDQCFYLNYHKFFIKSYVLDVDSNTHPHILGTYIEIFHFLSF